MFALSVKATASRVMSSSSVSGDHWSIGRLRSWLRPPRPALMLRYRSRAACPNLVESGNGPLQRRSEQEARCQPVLAPAAREQAGALALALAERCL